MHLYYDLDICIKMCFVTKLFYKVFFILYRFFEHLRKKYALPRKHYKKLSNTVLKVTIFADVDFMYSLISKSLLKLL